MIFSHYSIEFSFDWLVSVWVSSLCVCLVVIRMAICRVKCRLMPANWNPLSAVSYLKSSNEKRVSRLQHPRSVCIRCYVSVMALERFSMECRN